MFEIALIRPGVTDFDCQDRLQGTLQIPINAQGIEEATRIAEELKGRGITVLYTTACLAAGQTAERIAEALGVKLKRLDKLYNVNLGLWQGLQEEAVRHKHPKIYRQWEEMCENVCPPEGETLGEAKERLHAALSPLLKKHTAGMIGLVISRPLADLAESMLTKGEFGPAWVVNAEFGHWDLLGTEARCALAGGNAALVAGGKAAMETAPAPQSLELDQRTG